MLSIDRTFVTFQERAHPGGLKSNFIQISCLSRLLIDWARFDSYFGFEIMGQNDHQYELGHIGDIGLIGVSMSPISPICPNFMMNPGIFQGGQNGKKQKR
jgi:hypothetical protein